MRDAGTLACQVKQKGTHVKTVLAVHRHLAAIRGFAASVSIVPNKGKQGTREGIKTGRIIEITDWPAGHRCGGAPRPSLTLLIRLDTRRASPGPLPSPLRLSMCVPLMLTENANQ